MDYIDKFRRLIDRPLLSLELAGSILVIFGAVNLYCLATDGEYIVFHHYGVVLILIVLGVFIFLKNIHAWSLVLFSSFKQIILASVFALFFALFAVLSFISEGDIDGTNNFNGIYFYVSIIYYFLLSDEVLEYFKMEVFIEWLRRLRGLAFFNACIFALIYGFVWLLI